MSHFYTVRQTSSSETEVIVSDANLVAEDSNDDNKVTIVETVVETDENGEAGRPGTTTVTLPADTVQLMGMASTLPSSNLFVNYPHTMWERDSEGNRIPVTVVKAEEASAEVDQDDLLGTINDNEGSNDGETTTLTIAADGSSQVVTVSQPTASSSSSRIVVKQTNVNNGDTMLRPHVCEVCTKTFAKREHLTKHLRIHKSDNKRYSCEYCQKAFRDRYELVRHTRRHTGDFPFRCQECNKGFMRHERYMTHLRWHSGERPYLCTMCEKSFRDRSELNRHSRRHTGDLPYKCETCGKGFLRRERYVTHVRIHTGEKPFVCAVCSRGYRDRRELKKHQTTHNHSGQSAPIPGTGPVTIPPPNAAQTKTIVVQQPQHSPTLAPVHLPSTPVPKELLNINGQQIITQRVIEPLNPANIPLPPSVASALQSINEKVTRQQRQKLLEEQAQQQQQVIKTEPMITLQGSPTGSPGGSSSNGPLYYYLMPGSVPFSLTADGGHTVQVKTSDGSIATAQLVTVPSGALQSIVTSGAPTTSGSNNGPATSWIIETTTTSPPTVTSRNSSM